MLLCLLLSFQVMLETIAGETKLAALDHNLMHASSPHSIYHDSNGPTGCYENQGKLKNKVNNKKWFDGCFVTVRFDIFV